MGERGSGSGLGAPASALAAVAAWRLRSTLAQRTAGRAPRRWRERRWSRGLGDELHRLQRRAPRWPVGRTPATSCCGRP